MLVPQVLAEARIGHDSLARVRGLDMHALEPSEGELLVGWALSRHVKEHVPAATVDPPVCVGWGGCVYACVSVVCLSCGVEGVRHARSWCACLRVVWELKREGGGGGGESRLTNNCSVQKIRSDGPC